MANDRHCPLCSHRLIPVYRAMCRRCFDKVPWLMRARFLKAWQMRVREPANYQENLAGVQQWYRDYRSERMNVYDTRHHPLGPAAG